MFAELNEQLKTQLAAQGQNPLTADPVFELHPLQLQGFLEAVWEVWRRLDEGSLLVPPGPVSPGSADATVVALGTVERELNDSGRPELFFSDPILALLRSRDPGLGALPPSGRVRLALDVEQAARAVLERLLVSAAGKHMITPWPHLMYAYLVENTRAFEILAKVVQGSLTDEPFGALSEPSFRWLRLTEDLFFRDGASSLITSTTSLLRPDPRGTRRNAYQRLFGIDLNHGAQDGGAYPYTRAQVANADFVRTLQELLREAWLGVVNARNISGPRATDDANIEELLRKLQLMLSERRLSGSGGRANLAREEFVAVATLEWFELAVKSNTSIVVDLKANADEREDRLRKLGERVQLPYHGRSRSFFELSGTLPVFLREIEEGDWATPRPVAQLYDDTLAGNVAARTKAIINHWSIATGVDLKSVAVTVQGR
jgi:hypothetical protein